jgi:hypothetical protein
MSGVPATFIHPAAVLPLCRGPLVPAALVAGSVAPDAPYYLSALPVTASAQDWWAPLLNATESHSWPGVAVYVLPVSTVLVLGWLLVRRPVLDLLGVPEPPPWGPATAVWCLPSAAIGILTHVSWDRLMRLSGWWDVVSAAIVVVCGVSLAAALWSRRRPAARWSVLLRFGGLGLAAGVAGGLVRGQDGHSPQAALREAVFVGAVTVLVSVLSWSLAWHVSRRRAP